MKYYCHGLSRYFFNQIYVQITSLIKLIKKWLVILIFVLMLAYSVNYNNLFLNLHLTLFMYVVKCLIFSIY